MKKYLFYAATALALASCSSDDYLGNNPGNENGASSAINFAGTTGKTTRADQIVGGKAAELLGNQFVVAGYKGTQSADGLATTTVFDNYYVKWDANTAGTTDDNTSDWHYVGLTPNSNLSAAQGNQTIKYWDYATGQYDFIAFSTGKATLKAGDEEVGNDGVKVTKIESDKDKAYTMYGTKENLAKCYIADLVTAYNPKIDSKPEYQDVVKFVFRNLSSKVRVALYETVPGYSVKNVKFYADGTTSTGGDNATLYTSDTDKKFYDKGTATVSFPTVGTSKKDESDYNKAHVAITADANDNGKTACEFGTLNYSTEKPSDSQLEAGYLGLSSNKASYAGSETNNYYTTVLPNENGATLTLRVDYTLYANDKSGEEITVHGATAIVPAIYAQWKSNYAYTYIFKISDKTNGKTGTGETDPKGLFPITFDAVVADAEDGSQSTITTVADYSITTYQKGHDVNKNEYASGEDIYVMVHNGNDLAKLNEEGKAALYTVTKDNSNKNDISEATVHDALTIDSKTEGNVTTGRNGLKLTSANFDATITTIPGVDGNNIKVEEGQAVKFSTTTPGTYAFVYKTTNGEPTAKTLISAVTFTETTDLTNKGYYTDKECREDQKATGNSETGKIYYQKITNDGNTYAIKVIVVE